MIKYGLYNNGKTYFLHMFYIKMFVLYIYSHYNNYNVAYKTTLTIITTTMWLSLCYSSVTIKKTHQKNHGDHRGGMACTWPARPVRSSTTRPAACGASRMGRW